MAAEKQIADVNNTNHPVPVRTISNADIAEALREGWQDFKSKRGDRLMVGFLYPLVGLLMVTFITNGNSLPLLFPLMAGLSLLGPIASAGFYELARRREAGVESSFEHFFAITKARNFNDLMFVGMILLAIFALWMISAFLIYSLFFGAMVPEQPLDFILKVLTTPAGWGMIILGNLAGLIFAILVLATSFISLPMLVDRNIDAGLALRTSMRAFKANRTVSLNWGVRVVLLLALGSIPAFIGLAIVLPVLGYATWHIYTRMIDRSALPPAERRD